MTPQGKIRCRPIDENHIEAIVALLARGFPMRSPDYWRNGFVRQSVRAVPAGLPHYGYFLEADGVPVGVILLLFTSTDAAGRPRCNISSWYVEPAYRSHASLLIWFALKHKNVTYVNISPARHTWSTVEAQGFVPYCHGQFFALPALNRARPALRVEVFDSSVPEHRAMPASELLAAHAEYGCLSLVGVAADGIHPFVFQRFRIRGGRFPLPGMRLIYCREVADFVRFSNALGRSLLKRGSPWVVIDANGPIDGLVGTYRAAHGRKYFRGPEQPRLGDLAYSELVLFGP